jgi:hypothetical protein
VIKLARSGTGILVTILLVTACSTTAREATRLSVIECARAEADARADALQVGPLTGVTTSRDLAAAAKKMGQLGAPITGAIAVRDRPASSALSFGVIREPAKAPALPPPLSDEIGRAIADMNAFFGALLAYAESEAGPGAVGEAATRVMREVQAVRATCAA